MVLTRRSLNSSNNDIKVNLTEEQIEVIKKLVVENIK